MKYIINTYILFPLLFVAACYFWANAIYGIYLLSFYVFAKNTALLIAVMIFAANLEVDPSNQEQQGQQKGLHKA